MIALTGGVVVAVAIFNVLPEAMDAVGDAQQAAAVVGLGFLAFFLAERALVLHHRDDTEHARAHARVGALGAAGLAAHSFVDGLGIGLAFGVDTATGILVFLAVIAHDFADGLNTVSFVLRQSNDRRQAIRWLALDAAAPLVGAVVGASLTVSEHTLGCCSPPTSASSSTWARPTCCRTRTSTRRRGACCSPWSVSARSWR